MELVIQNANEEIKNLFENEVSAHPIAWRALHFFWKGMGSERMKELRNLLKQYMTDDLDSAYIFPWGSEDIFVLCRGVRLEPLQEAANTVKKFYQDAHPNDEDAADYNVSVYDLSIAWDDFREFFHFREKAIAQQSESSVSEESIAREEEEIKMVYEEPKPNPLVIRDRDSRPGLTVMIVEDDDATMRLLANMLRQFSVVRARDGRDALEKYYEYAPDIVFLDIKLPYLDGWEIMERIHEHDKNSFVVMVTAHAQADDVQKAIQLGVKGYIKKPFSGQKIQQYVEKFTKNAPRHKQVKSVF